MRLRRPYVLVAALLGVMAATLSVAAGSEPTPTIQAVNSLPYGHSWSPAQVSVAPGGSVTLSNPTTTPHGVEWVAGPNTPTCDSGVPVGTTAAASGKEWTGSCKFTQAGTYTFYCTVHGPEMTGTVTVTTPGAPVVTTGTTSGVSQTGVTLEGTVNPEGKATTYFFNYGTSTGYGQKTTEASAGESGSKAVSLPLNGLTAGTTYHYQLVAKNDSGTSFGSDRTFTTSFAPGAPTATTGTVTAVSETAATLSATVNPGGEMTEYFFEWGLDSTYGNATSTHAVAGEDHSGHAESASLTGLLPGTVYHYRVVAKNATGSSMGVDREFTTLSPPLPETPPAGPPTTGTVASTPPPTSVFSSLAPPPAKAGAGGSRLLGSLKLTVPRHGSSMHGTIEVGSGGASGRLEVDLLAKAGALGKTRSSKSVVVGRFVRASVSAGKVSFSISLSARGKQALKRHHSLAVSLKIMLAPKQGASASAAKSVTLRL